MLKDDRYQSIEKAIIAIILCTALISFAEFGFSDTLRYRGIEKFTIKIFSQSIAKKI